jgi:hypothetical protein
VELDSRSRYLFRGQPLTEEPVSQVTARVSSGRFTFYAWGNFLLGRELAQDRLSETDFGASYELQWKRLAFRPELAAYLYHVPSDVEAPSTSEGSLSVAYSAGGVSVFTKQVVDLGSSRGAYYGEAGFTLARPLPGALDFASTVIVAWASARYNRTLFGLEQSALNQIALELSVTWAPSERVQLRPHLELGRTADFDLRRHTGRPLVTAFGIAVIFERSGK